MESDGLLSQWRGYGGKGGFAIIFDSHELNKSYFSFSKKCKAHPGYNYFPGCQECTIHFYSHLFTNVEYCHDLVHSKNPEINIALRKHLHQLTTAIKSGQLFPLINNDDINEYIKSVMYLTFTLKNKSFREKNEIRFGCLNRLEGRTTDHFNTSPYEICIENQAPRLKIDFNQSAIKKILIGPQNEQEKMEILLKYFLEHQRLTNIEIARSKIPFTM